jgi:hypothetical protein
VGDETVPDDESEGQHRPGGTQRRAIVFHRHVLSMKRNRRAPSQYSVRWRGTRVPPLSL